MAQGLDGKSLEYGWQADIRALSLEHTEAWFRFRTSLQLPAPIRLQQGASRAANNYLVEFDFHAYGRTVGKLASRAA